MTDSSDSPPPVSSQELKAGGMHAGGGGLHKRSGMALTIGALGVVFGDIGTSPLYALRECFVHSHLKPDHDNVIGVLSLIIWSLILIICVKYLVFILRASNKGEGGVLALLALCIHGLEESSKRRGAMVVLAVFGAALLYGDGMITPAITVLGAVEGLKEVTEIFNPYVVPITIAILVLLFSLQSMGTERVGMFFGPITLVWFIVIAFLGVIRLVENPEVLTAFNPIPGIRFIFTGGWTAFIVLGSIFLVVTGGEALYADMGHFGTRPIRQGWFLIVFPALVLNYLGQGALLLSDPTVVESPFFRMVPEAARSWAMVPLVILATMAAVIASQALITGAYSLTLQAIQMGYFPRMSIRHTSQHTQGQIYIGLVNWLLMIACILLVIRFETSSALAAAYGVSVTLTMLITTVLFYFVTRSLWKWSFVQAMGLCIGFLILQGAFFAANLLKFFDGGWFPLAIGVVLFVIMTTWQRGRALVGANLESSALSQEMLIESIQRKPPIRVPGTAIFMTSSRGRTPTALLHNLKHNRVLHERIIFMTLVVDDSPFIPPSKRVELESLAEGVWRLTGHYGFMQKPDVPRLLRRCSQEGLNVSVDESTFFLGRETIVPANKPGMARWREHLFGFLSKIAQQPAIYFRIPPGRVIELGLQVQI